MISAIDHEFENLPTFGVIKDQKVHLGYNIWISKMVFDEIFRLKDNNKFVCDMAHAIWGPEILGERVVRPSTNTNHKELTPKKKHAVIDCMRVWLKNKRMMPDHLIDEELDRRKINQRFNWAITLARKKKKYLKETAQKISHYVDKDTEEFDNDALALPLDNLDSSSETRTHNDNVDDQIDELSD